MSSHTATCNLCGEVLPIDDVFVSRLAQHRNWHKPHKINGRKYINQIKGECIFEYK